MEGEPRSCSALEPCCQNILGLHYPLFLTSGKIMWESWCTSQPCSWLNRGSPGSCQSKITGWVWWAWDAAAPAGQGGMEPLGWLQGWGHSWTDTSAPEMAKHSMWGKRMKWAGATTSLRAGETDSGAMDTWTLRPWHADKAVIIVLHWAFLSLWMKKY